MTYIIPKSFKAENIYLKGNKNIHKIYYSFKNLRLMGIPFLLSQSDYECINGRIYILNKDILNDINDIDAILKKNLENYSSLLKETINGYYIKTNKFMNESKDIYFCIYKIINKHPQIYIVENKDH